MDLWTNDDTGAIIEDGTSWRYNRQSSNGGIGVGYFSFFDGTRIKYDAGLHVCETSYSDGANFVYNAGGNQYNSSSGAAVAPSGLSINLPAGSSFSLTLNGTTISVDPSGNVVIDATSAPTGISLIAAAGQLYLEDLLFSLNRLNLMINTFNAHVHDYLPGTGTETVTSAPTVAMT